MTYMSTGYIRMMGWDRFEVQPEHGPEARCPAVSPRGEQCKLVARHPGPHVGPFHPGPIPQEAD